MLIETIMGVVTGLAGNVLTTVSNMRTQKLKNEHDLKMREYDLKEREQEAKLQIAVDAAHSENEIAIQEALAYVESMKQANTDVLTDAKIEALSKTKSGSVIAFIMGLVDAFRASIRPGLTAYLVALTTLITIHSINILNAKGDLITALQAQEMFTNVTDIVIYLTVSCVTWWFGDRRVAKFAYRLNDGNKQDKNGY